MITSQSAATAVSLAIDHETPVQAVDYSTLKIRLLKDGQVIESKTKSKPRPKLTGIVIDDTKAEFVGDWTKSNAVGSLVGSSYHHDGNTGRGEKSATFSTKIEKGGTYDIRLIYTSHENRASKAAIILTIGGSKHTLTLNQRHPEVVDGKPRSLGVFLIQQGTVLDLTLLNRGADGFVSVDGLQIVPTD